MIMIENFNWKTLSFFIFRKKRGTWKKMSKKNKIGPNFYPIQKSSRRIKIYIKKQLFMRGKLDWTIFWAHFIFFWHFFLFFHKIESSTHAFWSVTIKIGKITLNNFPIALKWSIFNKLLNEIIKKYLSIVKYFQNYFFCRNLLEKAEKSNVNETDQNIFQNLEKNEKQTFKE